MWKRTKSNRPNKFAKLIRQPWYMRPQSTAVGDAVREHTDILAFPDQLPFGADDETRTHKFQCLELLPIPMFGYICS